MAINEAVFAIIITALAVSYGWGMRGAIIGGEKGAMLPGALLGLFLAKLSGIPAVSNNALMFSASACFAMSYGGFEPYAQTMEMVISPSSDIYNPKRGYTGLMLKGANWFGICGILLGISFSSISGIIYKPYEIAVIILSIPFVQALGIRIFNKPYDKAKGIFPKLYFSRNSREEWGGNLLTLTALMLAAAIKGDTFALFFGLTGIFSGATGWAIAIWLYYITVLPLKNGKYVFGKAQKNGFIDNWKIMEFALGLIGGGGLAAYFFLRIDTVKNITAEISIKGLHNALGNAESAVAWAVFAVILLLSVQYFIKKLHDNRLFELFERAVYFSAMLCLIMLGGTTASRLTVFLLILWAVTEKLLFDRKDSDLPKIAEIGYVAVFIIALICEAAFKISNSILLTMIMYTFCYVSSEILCVITRPCRDNEKNMADKFRGCLLTHLWFVILSVLLIYVAVTSF